MPPRVVFQDFINELWVQFVVDLFEDFQGGGEALGTDGLLYLKIAQAGFADLIIERVVVDGDLQGGDPNAQGECSSQNPPAKLGDSINGLEPALKVVLHFFAHKKF
jgi:hypothetical protein